VRADGPVAIVVSGGNADPAAILALAAGDGKG
jgi:hypothetical protein